MILGADCCLFYGLVIHNGFCSTSGGYMPMPTIQGASNPGYPSYPPSTAGGYQPPTSSYQPPTSSAGYNPGSYGGGYPPAQGYQGQQGYPPAAGYPPASGYPAASYAGQQYQTQASTTGKHCSFSLSSSILLSIISSSSSSTTSRAVAAAVSHRLVSTNSLALLETLLICIF